MRMREQRVWDYKKGGRSIRRCGYNDCCGGKQEQQLRRLRQKEEEEDERGGVLREAVGSPRLFDISIFVRSSFRIMTK